MKHLNNNEKQNCFSLFSLHEDTSKEDDGVITTSFIRGKSATSSKNKFCDVIAKG